MTRIQRTVCAALLVAVSTVIGGCSGGSFDPTDLLDWMDTKKKIPGDRKPVFPEGVPGLEQGVPKDLYRGAQQEEPAPEPAPAPTQPKQKTKKPKTASAPAQPPADPGDGSEPAAQSTAPKQASATKPKKKTTPASPPAEQPAEAAPQQQSQSAFPAPMPSGNFSR